MSPASYQTAPPRVDVLRSACRFWRAGNGTRTRDPNLGKVVLYQLSYSRVGRQSNRSVGFFVPPLPPPYRPCRPFSGGEGDRTPDLVNAIHALSQLSYAPVILGPAKRVPAGTRHLIGTLWRCQAFLCPHANFSTCVRYHTVIRDYKYAQAHPTEEDHLPRPGEAARGGSPSRGRRCGAGPPGEGEAP